MERKCLLIDVDDTLNRLQRGLLLYVNSQSVSPYRYWQLTSREMENGDPRLATLVREYLEKPDLVVKTKPFPRSLDGVRLLHEAGFKLHIASARKETLHQATEEWLARHGFINYIEDIHHRPSETRSFEFKVSIANLISARAAFDDTVSIAEALAENGTLVYLIRRPWNREITGNHIIRPYPSFYRAAVAFLNHNNDTN